jgi:hypothetical protein
MHDVQFVSKCDRMIGFRQIWYFDKKAGKEPENSPADTNPRPSNGLL